jgi:hypothetical protein
LDGVFVGFDRISCWRICLFGDGGVVAIFAGDTGSLVGVVSVSVEDNVVVGNDVFVDDVRRIAVVVAVGFGDTEISVSVGVLGSRKREEIVGDGDDEDHGCEEDCVVVVVQVVVAVEVQICVGNCAVGMFEGFDFGGGLGLNKFEFDGLKFGGLKFEGCSDCDRYRGSNFCWYRC